MGFSGLAGDCPQSWRKDGVGEKPVTVNYVGPEADWCAVGPKRAARSR